VALEASIVEGARAIVERVRSEGDTALVDLTRTYDGADIEGRIRVEAGEIEASAGAVPIGLRDAILKMTERLEDLHSRQLPLDWETSAGGVRYGERVKPLRSAGAYVPGGRASYPSTVLMTAIPARVAGVGRVVLCTPPRSDGSVPAPVLYASMVAGVDAVYRIGGAQAIAALAFGTGSVMRVDKIVGPGNAWVTAAKKEVSGQVGIDGLAGPTELVVIADATADPAVLAVDLVAQAEHDPLARTYLVTMDDALGAAVIERLEREVEASPRREIVETSLRSAVVALVPDLRAAAEVSDAIAPEHLQIVVDDPRRFLGMVRSYGAAFLGAETPVSFGDYGVGSNHVLPTMANARFSSGLRAADFVTVSSFSEASTESLREIGPDVEAIATAEGLAAHAKASYVRRTRG
jgi:histidinol dehydrogenase